MLTMLTCFEIDDPADSPSSHAPDSAPRQPRINMRRVDYRPAVLAAGLTLLLAFGQFLPPVSFFASVVHYLPLHTILEMLSIQWLSWC